MKIENSFTIDAPVEQAWALLTNIPEIAPCLPGAKLSGEEDGVYKGAVKIKVGPVTAEYRGTAEFVERDDVNHKAVIDGKGRDSRGAGNAQALITAAMRDIGGQTEVDISTDLKITGKVAQFGRGVMQDVSEKLLGQFAECLATKLEGTSALENIAAESAATDGAAGAVVDSASAATGAATGAVRDAASTVTGKVGDAAAAASDAASGVTGKLGDVAGAASGAVSGVTGKAGAVAAGAGAAVAGAGAGAAGKLGMGNTDDDDDALDLLDVAGGAVFKRLIPVAILLAIIILVLVLVL